MSPLANEPAVILIIDNDPLTLTGMAAVLNMQGYECHCARNGAAARKAVASLALDLIICDVDLGGENGHDLCSALRSSAALSDVPVMFVSGSQGLILFAVRTTPADRITCGSRSIQKF